jgi:hypothetical protein
MAKRRSKADTFGFTPNDVDKYITEMQQEGWTPADYNSHGKPNKWQHITGRLISDTDAWHHWHNTGQPPSPEGQSQLL